jgi:hypothetical protein
LRRHFPVGDSRLVVDLERVMASLKLMTTLIQTVMMTPTMTG